MYIFASLLSPLFNTNQPKDFLLIYLQVRLFCSFSEHMQREPRNWSVRKSLEISFQEKVRLENNFFEIRSTRFRPESEPIHYTLNARL